MFDIHSERHDGKSSPGDKEGDSEGGDRRGGKTEPKISHRPQPPPWPLVRGVFAFLFEPGAIIYWSMLSCLGTLCVALLFFMVAIGQMLSMGTSVSFVLSLAVTIFFSLAFTFINSVCCLTIIQESAAGNRVIEDWPGLAFIDYLFESFYVINSALMTVVAAWLVTSPLSGSELLRELCGFAVIVILFPIVLLSMLETQSCLLPVSAAVWQSLWRSLRTWLAFYVESFALAFGFFGYLAFLAFFVGRYAKEMTPPLVLFTIAMGVGPGVLLEMIYFRLIGRLAWVCDDDSRRELAEQETAEEEEQNRREAGEIRPTPVDDF